MISLTGKAMRSRVRAFTLIEMLIVIALLVILIGVAMPNMRRTLEAFRSRSTVERVHAVLDRAHDQALASHEIVHLDLEREDHGYRVFAHDKEDEAQSFRLPSDVRLEGEKSEVLFYPDGSIDTAEIVVMHRDQVLATIMTQGVWGEVQVVFK